MDSVIIPLSQNMRAARDDIQQGEELIRKVTNLNSRHKELINKLIDASDQCKDTVDVVLSSTNTMLDLMQKIVRTNSEEFNLLKKITELNSKEWDLARKFIYLCKGENHFIHKFMEWYLRDESSCFTCSCSSMNEVEHCGKNRCNVEKCNGNEENIKAVISDYVIQQEKTSEKIMTPVPEQGILREKSGNHCCESGILVGEMEGCTEPRNIAKDMHLTEKDRNSVEHMAEQEPISIFPAMIVKGCSAQLEAKNEDPRSEDSGQEIVPLQSKQEERKVTALNNSAGKETSYPSENVKVSNEKTQEIKSDLQAKEIKEIVPHSKIEIDNSVLAASENQSTISKDKIEEVDAHLSGKESKKIISDTNNSFLTATNVSNPLSEKICSIQQEVLDENPRSDDKEQETVLLQSKWGEVKRTALNNNTEKDTSYPKANMEVNKEEMSPQEINNDLPVKESKKIVSHTKKQIDNSVLVASENQSLISKNKIEDDANLSGKERNKVISDKEDSPANMEVNGETRASKKVKSHLTLKGRRSIVFHTETKGDNSVLAASGSMSTISKDKIKKVDAHPSGKKRKKIFSDTNDSLLTVTKITNPLSAKSCSVQMETEHKNPGSNDNEEETVPFRSKLRSSTRIVLDNSTGKETSFPTANEARSRHKMKSESVISCIKRENNCEQDSSIIAGPSPEKEMDIASLPESRKIVQLTDEVKLKIDGKHKRKLCMKKMGFLIRGRKMFTIAASITELLQHEGKEMTPSPNLLGKARSFFTEASAIYSSLEKYLKSMQPYGENRKLTKLSNCASRLLLCMLKLQHSIALRSPKPGVNVDVKMIIRDITNVMDVIAEIIMIATDRHEDDEQEEQVQEYKDEEESPLALRLTKQFLSKHLTNKKECHTKSNEEHVKDCYIKLVDVADVLRDKTTINLKEIKRNHIKISNVRKRNTYQQCDGRNVKKKKKETSNFVFMALQNHEPVKHTTNDINIPTHHELFGSSTKRVQVLTSHEPKDNSTNGVQLHMSNKPMNFLVFKVLQHHDPLACSPTGLQIPLHESIDCSTNGVQTPRHGSIECSTNVLGIPHHESIECSTNGLVVPTSQGKIEYSAIGNQPEMETRCSSSDNVSSNDNSSLIPMVRIKQEVIDDEVNENYTGAEGLDGCEEDLTDWQNVAVKEEVTIEEHSDFEMLKFGQGTCSAPNVDTANSEDQNLNNEEFVCSEDGHEYNQFDDDYLNPPKIQNKELVYSEEDSHKFVENTQQILTECKELVTSSEDAAGEQSNCMRIRVKPEFRERTDLVLSGAAAAVVSEMDKALGIHLPPFSVDRVGRLKWTQYTSHIDHPYSRDQEKPTDMRCVRYVCEICAKHIYSANNIKRHMNSHFKYWAVACNYCGESICNFQLWLEHRKICMRPATVPNEDDACNP